MVHPAQTNSANKIKEFGRGRQTFVKLHVWCVVHLPITEQSSFVFKLLNPKPKFRFVQKEAFVAIGNELHIYLQVRLHCAQGSLGSKYL